MLNEPVAWMSADGKFNKKETWYFPIPLYTHPVEELTDEEIQQVLNDFDWFVKFVNPFDFARAILRKAQEK